MSDSILLAALLAPALHPADITIPEWANGEFTGKVYRRPMSLPRLIMYYAEKDVAAAELICVSWSLVDADGNQVFPDVLDDQGKFKSIDPRVERLEGGGVKKFAQAVFDAKKEAEKDLGKSSTGTDLPPASSTSASPSNASPANSPTEDAQASG